MNKYFTQVKKRAGRSYPPPTITIPEKDFDALVERLELPSEETIESVKRLMNRPSPWSEQ